MAYSILLSSQDFCIFSMQILLYSLSGPLWSMSWYHTLLEASGSRTWLYSHPRLAFECPLLSVCKSFCSTFFWFCLWPFGQLFRHLKLGQEWCCDGFQATAWWQGCWRGCHQRQGCHRSNRCPCWRCCCRGKGIQSLLVLLGQIL